MLRAAVQRTILSRSRSCKVAGKLQATKNPTPVQRFRPLRSRRQQRRPPHLSLGHRLYYSPSQNCSAGSCMTRTASQLLSLTWYYLRLNRTSFENAYCHCRLRTLSSCMIQSSKSMSTSTRQHQSRASLRFHLHDRHLLRLLQQPVLVRLLQVVPVSHAVLVRPPAMRFRMAYRCPALPHLHRRFRLPSAQCKHCQRKLCLFLQESTARCRSLPSTCCLDPTQRSW